MNKNISLETIKEGILKSSANAVEMIKDAKILIQNKRYVRCYALSQLALEEVGKSLMLYNFYVNLQLDKRQEISVSEFKKHFYSHKKKTVESNMIDLMMFKKKFPRYTSNSQKFKDYAMKSFKDLKLMQKGYFDDLKNKSLYVSFVDDKFLSPSQILNNRSCRLFFKKNEEKILFWDEWIIKTIQIDEFYGADIEGFVKLLNES